MDGLLNKGKAILDNMLYGKRVIQNALHDIGCSVKPWRTLGTLDWDLGTDSYETWDDICNLILGCSLPNVTITNLVELKSTNTTNYGSVVYNKDTSPIDDKYKAVALSIKAIKLKIANAIKNAGFNTNTSGYTVSPTSSSDTVYESWQSYANKILCLKKSESFVFKIKVDAATGALTEDWRRTMFTPCYYIRVGNTYTILRKLLLYLCSTTKDNNPLPTSYSYSYPETYTINWDTEGVTFSDTGYTNLNTTFTFSSSADAFDITDGNNGNSVFFTYPLVNEDREYTITISDANIPLLYFNGESNKNYGPVDSNNNNYTDSTNTTLIWTNNMICSDIQVLNWGNLGLTSMYYAFNSTKLSSVPVIDTGATTFSNVTNFAACFRNTLLTTLPYDYEKEVSLFDLSSKCTLYVTCFYGSSKLTGTLPKGFFAGSPNASSFTQCFSGTKLTKIDSGCFANNTVIASLQGVFQGITTLETIPPDMFSGCTNLKEVLFLFEGCTALKGCSSATDETDETIYPISADLFADCKIITAFLLFCGCTNLQAVDTNFLNNSINWSYAASLGAAIRLDRMFYNCIRLTTFPLNIFPLFESNLTTTEGLYTSFMYGNVGSYLTSPTLHTINTSYTDATDGTKYTEPTTLIEGNFRGMFWGCTWLSGTSNFNTIYASKITLTDDNLDNYILDKLFGIYANCTSITNLKYELSLNTSDTALTSFGRLYNGTTFLRPTDSNLKSLIQAGYTGMVIHETTTRYVLMNVDVCWSTDTDKSTSTYGCYSLHKVGVGENVTYGRVYGGVCTTWDMDWADWWYPHSGAVSINTGTDTILNNRGGASSHTDNMSTKWIINNVFQDAQVIGEAIENDTTTYGFINYPTDYPGFYKAKLLTALNKTWYLTDGFHGYQFASKFEYFKTLFPSIFKSTLNIRNGLLSTYGIGCCEEMSSTNRLVTCNYGAWEYDTYRPMRGGREKPNQVTMINGPSGPDVIFITFVNK